MNVAITRLFVLFVVLFGLLVAFTSRWTVFEADSLRENTANRRQLLEDQQIPRGIITARDGKKLAVNDRIGRDESVRYVREYPDGPLFGHAVGYSFVTQDQAGLEKFYNDQLIGEQNEFASLIDAIVGADQEGENLRTTLDPAGQRSAFQALAGRKGAIVVMEPATGRVPVMASVPKYDPNRIPEDFAKLNRETDSPLLNRVTQAGYPPGSTMKVVTAVAAIDSGEFEKTSVLNGKSPQTFSGTPLNNFGNSQFGPIDLTEALTNSVNTVWGRVGERVGKETMYEYMDRFGFNADPPMDYPRSQMRPSGVYNPRTGNLLDEDDPIDVARVAIGQERLNVTPLQMAMVASAVANDGVLMEPRLVERITRPDGRLAERIKPTRDERVMKSSTSRDVTEMMTRVVDEGSGTAAALEGIKVAGKTGTAERGDSNQAWFIAFAPVAKPKYAIAVTIERTQGTGGEEAAPLAKQVLTTLLGRGGG
ncbi:MAG: penicillin-binding protein 2 [Thermoleophilaceae bacterium]|nr:penicillin-binding protein 2 [Thermoleophilaceae bacterium]